MKDFIVNLLLLVLGLAAFIAFWVRPKTIVTLSLSLALGYYGTQEAGLVGTVVGLLAGALVGAVVAFFSSSAEREIAEFWLTFVEERLQRPDLAIGQKITLQNKAQNLRAGRLSGCLPALVVIGVVALSLYVLDILIERNNW